MALKFNALTGKFDLVDNLPAADGSTNGYLTAADWNIFNNKLDQALGNYFPNPGFEIDLTGVDTYNDQGRTDPAYVVEQDLTFTAVASGATGNGINIDYIFHASQSYLTPLVTVVSPTHITIAWYNGPTVLNNPTATQLKAAFDAVAGAVAIATCAITGTAGHLQYITGSNLLADGGDVFPVDGTGGVVTGVTITRSTVAPLQETASLIISKDAANRQGMGVSFDFQIDAIDRGETLQVSFGYLGSTDMVLGAASDVIAFLYDVTNATFIPLTPRKILVGPTLAAESFVATFPVDSVSVNYRFGLHIATINALAWDLQVDAMLVDNQINPTAATQVPAIVLEEQAITGAVTDGMAVMWQDGNTAWQPATMASGVENTNLYGIAHNISGLFADITTFGLVDFSAGPFVGYNQYVDTTAGGLSPLPSPFTDTGVAIGKPVSNTKLFVRPQTFRRLVTSKGGLLTNTGANDGTGDTVVAAGSNGAVPFYNSAAANGIQTGAAVVAGTGLVYTLATRTLTLSALAGDVTGAPQTNAIAAATVTGKVLTGFVSGAGTVTAADTILTAFNKINGNVALKANIASPTFTGVPAAPTAAAATNTTQLATTAFVTTADNLKAPLASPIFTGDVTASTGNVLVSTIGKGLQVKTGTNAKIGAAVLVGGTKTVANTSITANSRIFFSVSAVGGTPSFLSYTKINATSFTINSANVLDTSTVDWHIIESIP